MNKRLFLKMPAQTSVQQVDNSSGIDRHGLVPEASWYQ
jgi:hypothetical protein